MKKLFAAKKRMLAVAVLLAAAVIAGRQLVHSQAPVAQAGNVQVNVPAGWQWNTAITNAGGPISLNTFQSVYLSGGVIPPGGAEIEVTRGESPSASLGDIVKEETAGVSGVSLRELSNIAGGDAIRIYSQDSFGASLQYDNVSYYLLRNGKLYKFYLSHHSGDPNSAGFVKAFDQLVTSARIAQ